MALENIVAQGLESRIKVLAGRFEELLPNIQDSIYDMIFVDGFESSLELFNMFEPKLKSGGFMVVANLWQKKNNPVVARLQDINSYQFPFYYDDTIFGVKR